MTAVIIGYLVAIITTVVIMLVFDHGQPALLYLVPGCLISVAVTAMMKDELNVVWNHNEEVFLSNGNEKKEK